MNTQRCCITAALCYTLSCMKKSWHTCTCPALVHHHSLQSSISGYEDFVKQTSQIMILVCAWFLLYLQNEPYCDVPWVNIRTLRAQLHLWLKTMPEEWTTRVFDYLQMDRHTDHIIDSCILGYSLIRGLCMDLIFFLDKFEFLWEKQHIALCWNRVLKIQSVCTNWGHKFRNYGKILTKCHLDQLPTFFCDIIPMTSENTALSEASMSRSCSSTQSKQMNHSS